MANQESEWMLLMAWRCHIYHCSHIDYQFFFHICRELTFEWLIHYHADIWGSYHLSLSGTGFCHSFEIYDQYLIMLLGARTIAKVDLNILGCVLGNQLRTSHLLWRTHEGVSPWKLYLHYLTFHAQRATNGDNFSSIRILIIKPLHFSRDLLVYLSH